MSNAYDFYVGPHSPLQYQQIKTEQRGAGTVTTDKQHTALYYQLPNCALASRLPEQAPNAPLSKEPDVVRHDNLTR